MTNKKIQLSDKAVAAFRDILSDEAIAHITEQEFHELNLIIHEALSQQVSRTADIVEDVAKQLRHMTVHQDIDL